MKPLVRALALACLAATAVACVRTTTTHTNRQVFQLPQSSTARIDDVTMHTLRNGLTLLHRENKSNSIVGVVMYLRTGAAEEPEQLTGLTNLMMRLLPKGTRTRNADQIAEELALLGTSLSPSAGKDYCKVSLQCVADDLDEAMALYADVIQNPSFPLDELALEKKKVLAQIRMGNDLNHVIASKRFMKELFGAHPYGRPMEGDEETVKAVEPGDLVAAHEAAFVPSSMVLAVVGNVSFDRARALAEEYFGEAREEKLPTYAVNKLIAPGGARAEIVRKSEQAFIVMGHLTCPTGDPDEAAVEVATAVLGAGMSSRLFVELRDRQGLAYAVGASSTFLKNQGCFIASIGTAPKNIDRATDGLWAEIERLRNEPVGEEELQRSKNYIGGQFLRAHERNMQQAGYLAYWYVTGRPPNYDDKYIESINAVTSRDVMRVANKYFLEPATVIVRPEERAEPEPAPR